MSVGIDMVTQQIIAALCFTFLFSKAQTQLSVSIPAYYITYKMQLFRVYFFLALNI